MQQNSSDKKESKSKYVPIKLLGEGSFGKAYLVENTSDRTLAVIKTIDIENMSESERKEAYFEAKILQKLDHQNIIKFKDVFFSKKPKFTLHIVMDFADGGDLQSKIKSQKSKYFSETQILDWFTQICLAIKHIHDRKILHRDIKSQNIFLTKHGLAKLGDFGISRCLNFTLDKVSTVVGTPYFLSPEIVQNKPYSFKSDIWSLGVILYEMCALKMPFEATSLPMLSLKIIRGTYGALPSNYSKELKHLVFSMLSVDSNKRPSINEILKLPILSSRIKNFLTELEFNSEFSHTILHNINILQEKSKKQKEKDMNQNNLMNVKHEKSDGDLNVYHIKKHLSGDKNKEKNFYVVNDNTPIIKKPETKHSNKDLIHINEVTKSKNDKINDIKDINNFLAKKSEQKKKNNEGNDKQIIFKQKSSEKDKIEKIQIQPNIKDFIKKMVKELNQGDETDIIDQDINNSPDKFNKKVSQDSKELKEDINTKDLDDFINTQKMLVQLHEINNEKNNISNSNNSNSNNNNNDNYSENSDLMSEKTPSGEFDNSLKYDEEEKNLQEVEGGRLSIESTESSNINNQSSFNYNEYETSEFEEIRINLEKELGSDLFYKIKIIICEKTPIKQLNYDLETLKKAIFSNLGKNFDAKTLNLAIDKIPEIYSIVVKEREKLLGYKK